MAEVASASAATSAMRSFFIWFVNLLIHQNVGIPVGVGVDPGGLVFLHIDAAVASIVVEGSSATRVNMWELRSWTEVLSPPGIMDEKAAPVVENRIVNWRRGIPEG